MSDTFYAETYEANYDTRYADAGYTGAVSLFETGPNVDLVLAKQGEVAVYDCGQNDRLTLVTTEALTLEIATTPQEIHVRFNVAVTVNVGYVDCTGQQQSFYGSLDMTGEFTFKPGTLSCADLSRCCGSGSFTSLPKGAFTLTCDTALFFQDGSDTGGAALVIENNATSAFAAFVEGKGATYGDEAVGYGAYALATTLAPERSSDPFEGFGGEDDDILKAIGDWAQSMLFNPTSQTAEKAATTTAMWSGLEYVFDYTAKALAVAAVTPTDVGLASSSDSGAKGDGLTNVRQLKIDGVTGKYAQVSVFDGDKLVGTGKADYAGVFHVTTTSLSDGTHTLTVVGTDSSGVSGKSESFTVTVDTKGPAAPTLGEVSASGLAGKAEAGSTVSVYDGKVLLGTTTAGADGAWSLAAAINPKAVHTLTATSGDAAGNVSVSDSVLYGASSGKLTGGYGDDVLAGSDGATLTGGWGRDLFVFEGAFGRGVVADFSRGVDKIRVDQDLAHDFADLKAHAAQTGADVTITLDAAHVIVLKGVALSSLSSGDFLFG